MLPIYPRGEKTADLPDRAIPWYETRTRETISIEQGMRGYFLFNTKETGRLLTFVNIGI